MFVLRPNNPKLGLLELDLQMRVSPALLLNAQLDGSDLEFLSLELELDLPGHQTGVRPPELAVLALDRSAPALVGEEILGALKHPPLRGGLVRRRDPGLVLPLLTWKWRRRENS